MQALMNVFLDEKFEPFLGEESAPGGYDLGEILTTNTVHVEVIKDTAGTANWMYFGRCSRCGAFQLIICAGQPAAKAPDHGSTITHSCGHRRTKAVYDDGETRICKRAEKFRYICIRLETAHVNVINQWLFDNAAGVTI